MADPKTRSAMTQQSRDYGRRPEIMEKNAKYRRQPNVRVRRTHWHARRRARERGVTFDLSLSDMPVIPEVCPVLGIVLSDEDHLADGYPELDRIKAADGYIRGNVAFISKRANRLKQDASVDELERIIRWIRSV